MEDPNLVMSGHSREHSQEGGRVKINIFRLEREEEWTLEVVAEDGTSTVWDNTFVSARDALDEALLTVDKEGVRSFLEGGNVIPFRR
jgi:hypothetical protein